MAVLMFNLFRWFFSRHSSLFPSRSSDAECSSVTAAEADRVATDGDGDDGESALNLREPARSLALEGGMSFGEDGNEEIISNVIDDQTPLE